MSSFYYKLQTGALVTSVAQKRLHIAAAKLPQLPKCAACQYGKQHHRPTPGKHVTNVRNHIVFAKTTYILGNKYRLTTTPVPLTPAAAVDKNSSPPHITRHRLSNPPSP
jgi:hypothetical protein